MIRAAATCLALVASLALAGGRAIAGATGDETPALPDYAALVMMDLYLGAQRKDGPYATEGAPFRVLGKLQSQDDDADADFVLVESAMLCCSVHLRTGFRVSASDALTAHDGDWVAVFGRLRPIDDGRRVRGAIGRTFIDGSFLIDPELIVPAERVIHRENIVEIMQSPHLEWFTRAVRESGLEEELRAIEPITVFAPVDHAFESLEPDHLDRLFEPGNRETLRLFVLQHVANGRLLEADLRGLHSLRTLGHEGIDVTTVNGSLRLGPARTLFENLRASNGVMHMISAVWLPESPESRHAPGNSPAAPPRAIP